MLELEHLGRVIALVRDPEHVTSGAEREQQLGGVGDEARDPHAPTVRVAAREANLARVAVLSDAEIAGPPGRPRGLDTSTAAPSSASGSSTTSLPRSRSSTAWRNWPSGPTTTRTSSIHGWNKVRLTLSTHSEGGLTESDFALAARIDGLA